METMSGDMMSGEMMAGLVSGVPFLAWSVLLLFAYMLTQSGLATKDRSLTWNAGPRDEAPAELGKYASRADRAFRNFLETYPAFVALALGLAVTGQFGGLGYAGAALWFFARLVYLPFYVFGVPYVRSIIWMLSIVGLLLMLVALF